MNRQTVSMWRRVILLCVIASSSITQARSENWPRFRGENGSGLSADTGLPKSWGPNDYAWTAKLSGEGNSSPVIWNASLFITSATEEGTSRHLICLNAHTGEQNWIQTIKLQTNAKHTKNSWASASPTTDGERVYVTFADGKNQVVAAYDFRGNVAWQRELGEYKSQHGHGPSPIVFENLLILPNDQDGPSSLIALNRDTGATEWTTKRNGSSVSYATPIIVPALNGPSQLITASGSMGITSYDPTSGKLNWATGSMPGRVVGSPLFDGKNVVQACGALGNGLLLLSVNPWEVDKKKVPATVFQRTKNLPFVPTPIAYRDHLYLWNDNGVVHCANAATGDNVWTRRVGGNYSGSPICVDGTLYIIAEDGKVVVLAASPEFQKFAEVPLNDPSYSTPACANGRIYFRTQHSIACLAAMD